MQPTINLQDIMQRSNALTLFSIGLLLVLFTSNLLMKEPKNVLGLVPANTLIANKYVWNVLTSSFFETNIVKLALDITGIYSIANDLSFTPFEQFGLYFIFSILACSILTSAWSFIRFFGTADETMLTHSTYGFSGVFFTVLMFARLQKRSNPVFSSFPSVTYNNLTFAVVVLQIVFVTFKLNTLANDLPFSFISICFSWSYLRFFYRNVDGTIGDQSEEFSFVSMFPVVLHPVAVPLTTAFYNLFALTGLFPPIEVEKRQHHHLRSPATRAEIDLLMAAPRQPDVVAERRRIKAQKLLDEKMAQLAKEPESWEDSEDALDGPLESKPSDIHANILKV